MRPALIPQPRCLRMYEGSCPIPMRPRVAVATGEFAAAGKAAAGVFRGGRIDRGTTGEAWLRLAPDPALPREGYRLTVRDRCVLLGAGSAAGALHGVRTLGQLVGQCQAGALPRLTIRDWPDMAHRGVYYDVARGRVPKLESLLHLADRLAAYKINELQLYIEHTFRFAGHPAIGRGASPLRKSDILALDAFCLERGIELVPSLATFGHLATVLKHRAYRHLAEDRGVGRYVAPAEQLCRVRRIRGWTLSPANPETYTFLESLFDEFLPCFSSSRFNICCDETWDLGLGQTYELCRRKGKGRVYLDHILRVRRLAKKHGKQVQFWGDIIRHYPELISRIPGDVTVLDWAYGSGHRFNSLKDFTGTGLTTYACPGTSSWVSLFPRLHESAANIHGFAAAAGRHGAAGLLNTDWGDGGHYNFMEYSWYGYLLGAEQAWNCRADRASFPARFAERFFRIRGRDFREAVERFGDITHLNLPGYYQSVWRHVFFATAQDPVLDLPATKGATCRHGEITRREVRLNAALGRRTLARLDRIREIFIRYRGKRGVDPDRVLPYWIFAVDTHRHAARKLTVLGKGGTDTRENRRLLKREMRSLMRRFETLWMARNRPSEIRITLKQYRRAIDSY